VKPLIGIRTRVRPVMSWLGTRQTHTLARAYTDVVRQAGGLGVLVACDDPADARA
jgi:gamma-glutamyl-gamma-aminobutyrate hydrolase PuuD